MGRFVGASLYDYVVYYSKGHINSICKLQVVNFSVS